MFHIAFLLLFLAAPQDLPQIAGDIKELPASGKAGPLLTCEGTTNLPKGALLKADLFYGRVIEGRQLFHDCPTVSGGKFSQDFPVFSKKILAGNYVVRLVFEPDLQRLAVGGFARSKIELSYQVGTAEDVKREAKAIRDQLAGEFRGLKDLGDEVSAKLQELKGKPREAWDALLKEWEEKTFNIQARTAPHKVPEYRILDLDQIADGGIENLCSTLIAAARCAAVGNASGAVEGLTRLRQTADYWASELAAPKLTDPAQIVHLIEQARALLQDVLAHPDAPVLPARRKFVEMSALLDKSLPEDFHATLLEIGTRSVAFFNALADKQPDAKNLQAELDVSLDKLAAPLRRAK